MTPIEIGLTVAVVVLFVGVVISRVRLGGRIAECEGMCGHLKACERRDENEIYGDDYGKSPGLIQKFDGMVAELANHKLEIAQFIKLANGSEQKRDAEVKALWMEVFGDPAANRKNGLKQGLLDLATLSESHEKSLHELAAKHLPVHASHDLLTELERQIAEVRETVAGMLVSRVALKASPFEEVNYRGLVDKFGYRPEAFDDAAHAACPDPRWKSDCEPAGDDARRLTWSIEYGDHGEEVYVAASVLTDDGDPFQWRITPTCLGDKRFSLDKSSSELMAPTCEYATFESASYAAQMLEEAIWAREVDQQDDQVTTLGEPTFVTVDERAET